jgi:hypothetical protein
MEHNEAIAGQTPRQRPADQKVWLREPQVTIPVAQAMQRHSGSWKSTGAVPVTPILQTVKQA